MNRILGLDFGTKFTGVSISDKKQRLALPLTTIVTKNRPKLKREIISIVREYEISLIVLGLPKNPDKQDEIGMVEKRVRKLKIQLEQENLEVAFWDESSTSKMVNNVDSFGDIHARAATLILQEYLDHKYHAQKRNE